MKTKKRFVIFFALLIAFIPLSLSAQQTDGAIVGIENGALFGYNLGTVPPGLGVGNELAVSLTVADNVQTGFLFITGDGVNFPNFNLFELQYALNQRIGVNIFAGRTGANFATGAGLYFNLFRRVFANTVVTLVKVKMDYLIDMSLGIDKGLIVVGLSGKIGI